MSGCESRVYWSQTDFCVNILLASHRSWVSSGRVNPICAFYYASGNCQLCSPSSMLNTASVFRLCQCSRALFKQSIALTLHICLIEKKNWNKNLKNDSLKISTKPILVNTNSSVNCRLNASSPHEWLSRQGHRKLLRRLRDKFWPWKLSPWIKSSD